MLQMEEAKAEVEKKLSTLTKLIQNKNKIPKNTKKELVGSVNDLHEQCKLLYSVFHDLKIGEREGESSTGPPTRSSSDLYYFSSEETDTNETMSSGFPVMIRNEPGEKEQELTARVKELERELLNKFGINEDLKRQVKNLKQETEYLRDQNMELAGDIEGKRNEDRAILMTKDVVAMLRNQKTELELELEKKTNEVSETRKRLKRLEEEGEERVNAERKIVKENQDLLNKLQKLEVDMSKEITESDRLKEENQKLLTKIAESDSLQEDKEKLLKEQKEAIDKFSEEQKQMKRWSFGSKLINTKLLERKMEEIAEDFQMKMEDRIRILYRRVHVAEQIHLESKNDYIKTKKTGDSNVSETQIKKIKDMMEQGLAGPEMAIKKLEESEELSTRVTRLAKEVDSARKCVQEKKSKMKHEVESLEAKLECREAQESLLKEKMSKLEAKLAEEGTGKMSLEKAMRKIKKLEINVKEREVELLSLGEEKREAIRQLCVLVDYNRCRYDLLKTSICKVALHA